MPLPESTDAVSRPGEIAGGIAGLLGLIGMVWNALRPKKEEVTDARSISETVSLVNDKPLNDRLDQAVGYLRRIADGIDVIVAIDRDRKAAEELRQVRADARIEAQEEDTRRRLNDRLLKIEEAERTERNERRRLDQ